MMPITTAGMNTVPVNQIARASSLNNVVRQVAASFFSRDDLLSFTEKTFDKVKNAANFVVSSILVMKSQVLVL